MYTLGYNILQVSRSSIIPISILLVHEEKIISFTS